MTGFNVIIVEVGSLVESLSVTGYCESLLNVYKVLYEDGFDFAKFLIYEDYEDY